MGIELCSGDTVEYPLVLDPKIRDWVLIPISVVMVLVTLVRTLLTRSMQSPQKTPLTTMQEKSIVCHSQLLRQNHHILSGDAFGLRRAFLRDRVLHLEKPEDSDITSNMAADPTAMMGPLKGQVMNMLPNIIIMTWVNYFFSGFVVIKLPFMLTPRFRGMLQRGIEAAGLDFNYVSSISWYFLNFMGLNPIVDIILEWCLGSQTEGVDTVAMMAPSLSGSVANGASPTAAALPPDLIKVFNTELENLNIVKHDKWALADVEQRLLKK